MKIFMVKETKYARVYNADGTICGQRICYAEVLGIYDSMEKAIERLVKETKVYRPKAIIERCGYIPIDSNTGEPLTKMYDIFDEEHHIVEVAFTRTGNGKIFEIETRDVE